MDLPTPFHEEEESRLPTNIEQQLRDALMPLLPDGPSTTTEKFVKDACYWVARFCEFEPSFRNPSVRQIKKELANLDSKLRRLEAALRKLSPDTLEELGLDWWWNVEPLPEPDLPTPADTLRIAVAAGLSPPIEGNFSSTHSVGRMLLELRRVQTAVSAALEMDRKLAVTSPRKGGAPPHVAWSLLAWRLARAFEYRFGKLPSSSPDGNFEMAFSECLKAALSLLGTTKPVPESLHTYVLAAVSSLKPSKK